MFNQLLDGAGLFGKTPVAIDGTKIRAQNSKKNNISEEKILKRLDYHENRFLDKQTDWKRPLTGGDDLRRRHTLEHHARRKLKYGGQSPAAPN